LLAEGRSVRVEFTPSQVREALQGLVVDDTGRPIHGVNLSLSLLGGSRSLGEGGDVPVWGPRTFSAQDGSFCLPRPDDPSERCVVRRPGFAARVLTIAEIDATSGQIQLESARIVLFEVLGRNGERMEVAGANWSECVRPSALVGHDVWGLGAAHLEPVDGDQLPNPPCFRFDQLPSGVVQFRLSNHDPGLIFEHDTRDRIVHWKSPHALDELRIGQ
jgi:hypothetical protein